ncbi:MAG: hypothetical protein ACYDAA_07015 [Syntrophales bacterium]
MIISGLTGVVGYLGGFSATRMLIPLFTECHGAHVPFDPVLAAGALLLSLSIGLAASSYPALADIASRPERSLAGVIREE